MPYTRFINLCFLLVTFMMAIAGGGSHPWFTNEVLWLAVLFAFFVWLMSLVKNFFLDIIAIFFDIFFLQRIIVIYFSPEEMSYQSYLVFSSQNFTEAILFCIGISMAILLGYFFAVFLKRDTQKQNQMSINFDKFFGVKYDFEHLFRIYALFFYASIIFEIFLMGKLNVGVIGLDFDRQFAPLMRILHLVYALYFLQILVLTSGKFSPGTRKTALNMVIIFLMKLIFLNTSKAAVIFLCVIFFVCQYYCGKRITRKYVVIGCILLVFTIVIVAPVTMILRSGVRGLAEGSSDFAYMTQMVINNYSLALGDLFFSFTNRLGAFDWLVGFMTAGREAFMPVANIYYDMVNIINTLVPGDLIPNLYENMPVSKLIPHVLRGLPLGSYPGHSENMAGAGMAYLYFGTAGGCIFLFVWSFISSKILMSVDNIIIKLLFFDTFVVNFFLGGDLTTSFTVFYEGLIMFVILIFISRFRMKAVLGHTGIMKPKAGQVL